MDFALSDEQRMTRDMARDFAINEILPVAEHYDQSDEYPWPVIKKAHKVGLMGLNIPEAYGGPGLGVLDECIVNEELAWACSGIQTALMLNSLAAWPIILAGSDEQRKRFLPRLSTGGELAAYCLTEPAAGSDVAAILATARRDGNDYILNGSKMWITNGPVANFFSVFAKTDPQAGHKGMSCFVVERDTPGVSVSKPIPKMGQHAAWTGEVVFEDVRVPCENLLGKEGQGFLTAMQVFDRSRPPVAAAAVGVARRAMEEATKYAKERKAFGKPIIANQGVSFMLADMAMSVEAGRLLTYKAGWLIDNGQTNVVNSAFAKAFCADMCMKVTTDAVQVFGGYGYGREYPVEKLMRDAKIYQLYEGTSQIQRVIISREMAK
ncbi:MAG TPA: acyl-CoA dehydrogenase family protein [Anaerolineae bacterium]